MDLILLLATSSLVLQLFAVSVLVLGYRSKKKRDYKRHGALMSIAVISHALSFLVVMGPALISLAFSHRLSTATLLSTFTIFHAGFGSAILIAGIWLIGNWRFQAVFQKCYKRKRVMKWVFISWTINASVGVLVFLILYVIP